MSGEVSLRGFAFTWPLLTAKMQKEDPVQYEKCILYIRREKLRNGFVAKRICKANSQGTKITFEKVQSREEAKKAADELIDAHYSLKERIERENNECKS